MRIPDALLAAYRKYEGPHKRGPHFAAVVYAIEEAMKASPVTPLEVLDWLGEPDLHSPDGDDVAYLYRFDHSIAGLDRAEWFLMFRNGKLDSSGFNTAGHNNIKASEFKANPKYPPASGK